MRFLALALAIGFSSLNAQAQEVVKSCLVNIVAPNAQGIMEEKRLDIKISQQKEAFYADIKAFENGGVKEFPRQEVLAEEFKINIDLQKELDKDNLKPEDYNKGEYVLIMSQIVLNSPEPEADPYFKLNFDLKKVASVKTYQVGQQVSGLGMYVVEAQDQNGLVLGSFVSALFPFMCQ